MRNVAAFASWAGVDASLEDYTNFHGMLCHPATATRCIGSFTGSIFFAPSDDTRNLERYDCTGGILSLCSYYLLVLMSFTGLSTLLRQTEFRTAREYSTSNEVTTEIVSEHDSMLVAEPHVLDYCKEQTKSSSLHLKRRFEYNFGLVGLSVMMLHLECDKKLLHLVGSTLV